MEKSRGSKRLRRVLRIALLAGILWVIAAPPAFACHAFSFESRTYSVAENAPNVAIVIKRDTAHLQGTSSVNVSTTDQSAESGQDFTAFNQAVSFGPAESSKRIEIALKDDTTYEGSENFAVKLSTDPGSPPECTVGSGGFAPDPNPTVVTIQENDPQTSGTAPQPGSQPGAKPPAAAPGAAPPGANAPATGPSPSPTDEEIGPNVAGDLPKEDDGGPPIGTILLIAGGVLLVGGGIGVYYYLGTRD